MGASAGEDPMLPRYTDKCRCSICGEYFNSSSAFGKHRYGPYAPINKPDTRKCRTATEMSASGWLKNATGHWVTGRRTAEAVAQRREAAQ